MAPPYIVLEEQDGVTLRFGSGKSEIFVVFPLESKQLLVGYRGSDGRVGRLVEGRRFELPSHSRAVLVQVLSSDRPYNSRKK